MSRGETGSCSPRACATSGRWAERPATSQARSTGACAGTRCGGRRASRLFARLRERGRTPRTPENSANPGEPREPRSRLRASAEVSEAQSWTALPKVSQRCTQTLGAGEFYVREGRAVLRIVGYFTASLASSRKMPVTALSHPFTQIMTIKNAFRRCQFFPGAGVGRSVENLLPEPWRS